MWASIGMQWLGYHRGSWDVITCRRRCMDRCKIDEKQSPCHTVDGPLHPLSFAHQPHEHIVLWIGYLMREILETMIWQTGLSSQSSPYSSIFANRSSTIGLINSISCWICEGRFDNMRETILKCIQWQRNMGRGDYAQLQRLRNQSNDCGRLHDIDSKG